VALKHSLLKHARPPFGPRNRRQAAPAAVTARVIVAHRDGELRFLQVGALMPVDVAKGQIRGESAEAAGDADLVYWQIMSAGK
jgi:hypothetical protein